MLRWLVKRLGPTRANRLKVKRYARRVSRVPRNWRPVGRGVIVPVFAGVNAFPKERARHYFGMSEDHDMSIETHGEDGDYFDTAILHERALHSFIQKLHGAFGQMLDGGYAGSALHAWRRFLTTYEYRRQFPWLEESGRQERNGLVAALRQALRTYDAPDPEDKEEHRRSASRVFHTYVAPLSHRERSELIKAAVTVARDQRTAEHFAYRLSCSGVRIETIESSNLRNHLVRALNLYAERGKEGISQTP